MSPDRELKPLALRREGDGLAIDWSDGARTFATWQSIRRHCPCASCNEARQKPADPFKVLSDKEVAAGPPQPVRMVPRGHYAYQIVWTDGHDTGIYTLELLRQVGEPAPPA